MGEGEREHPRAAPHGGAGSEVLHWEAGTEAQSYSEAQVQVLKEAASSPTVVLASAETAVSSVSPRNTHPAQEPSPFHRPRALSGCLVAGCGT